MTEKEFTFTNCSGFNNGKPVKETYTLKESQLGEKELDLLTGELIKKWDDSPREVQRRMSNRIRFTRSEVLDYEIRSHWLASWIWFGWGQDLLGIYFAWKVSRKYKRYSWSILMAERIKKVKERGELLNSLQH